MHPLAFVASLCALLVGAMAAPVAESGLSPREVGLGLQCWSEPEFTGKFVHYTAPNYVFGVCYDISADFPPYTQGGLSSVKADHKNSCVLYPNKICDPGVDSDATRLQVTGSYYDLADPEEGFPETIQSFKCFQCDACNN